MESTLYRVMFIGSDDEIFSAIKAYIAENKEYDEYPLYHNLPLHYAISARRLKIVEYLLELDYDPNVMTDMGYYPIQLISMKFNLTMLPIDTETHNLVKKYMKQIRRDCTRFTTSVSIPIAREILKGNTNMSKSYMIELSEKVSSDELRIADLLISYGAEVNSIGGGSTALHYAAKAGNLYIVRLLIACGADVTIKTFLGDSIFLNATKSNNVDTVKEVHSRNYLSDFTDDFKKIIKLAHNYTTDMLDFLKDIGFDINTVDDLNRTILHYTCFYTTNDEKIKRILDYGVNINAIDNDGFTALHYAIIYSNVKAVKILLEYGADVNINTKNDDDVFDLAVETKNTEIVIEVIQYYSNYINNHVALGNVTCSNDLKMISLLLNIGFDVNGKYYNSSSLLHLAVIFGKPETVKVLLEYGANPNITDKYGTTPLESALTTWHISKKYKREFAKLMTIDLVFRLYASPHDNDYSFDRNMSIIQYNGFLRKIKELCLNEIETMKSVKINNEFSLHSLLMSRNVITVLDDNPSFKQIIRNNLCNFHIYKDRIEEFITNTSKSYI
uniref:Ankyrin repeat containing protein n=1 Tax=Apapanepox virus TaxID=3049969 RepID=A0AAT9UPI9_9POXV